MYDEKLATLLRKVKGYNPSETKSVFFVVTLSVNLTNISMDCSIYGMSVWNKKHIAERVVELNVTEKFIVNRGEAEVDNEISRGNNLFYHPLSYVLFVLLYWTKLLTFHLRTPICIKHTPKWQKNINKYKKCM
jgi:hypothetical protein